MHIECVLQALLVQDVSVKRNSFQWNIFFLLFFIQRKLPMANYIHIYITPIILILGFSSLASMLCADTAVVLVCVFTMISSRSWKQTF